MSSNRSAPSSGRTRSTWLIMSAASVCLAAGGVACLFLPDELSVSGVPSGDPVLIQLLGALYLGFAAANWTARGSMIGGIYARPLAAGNLAHFFIGATVMLRELAYDAAYLAVTAIYLLFSAAFATVLIGWWLPAPRSGTRS